LITGSCIVKWIKHGEKSETETKTSLEKGMEMKSAQQMTLSKARIEKSESKEKKERKERAQHAKSEAIQSNYQKLERIPPRDRGIPPSVYICPLAKRREPRAMQAIVHFSPVG
jgi:hypothetical protein